VPVLALDIGGTKLEAGVVTADGKLSAAVSRATDPQALPPQLLAALLEMAHEAVRDAGVTWSDLTAAGISYGGPVHFPSGRTVTCHHLPGWEDFPLREEVAHRAGLRVVMDNDANAAALGETAFGAARGCRHVLYVTVSTGIGAGLVLDGRLYRGANSLAGELGHVLVVPDGPLCTCGRRGCLEAAAAGPAIERAAREALAAGEPSSLSAGACTAKDTAQAAATDALAARVMADAGRSLGIALAGAVNLLNPEAVVIGGGVAQAGECLWAPLRAAVSEFGVPKSVRDLRLLPAALGARSALFGAGALALGD